MKKKNLLLTLAMAVCAWLGAINVSAATFDASACKDGVVYTNYFYFLAAQVKDTTGSSNDSTKYGNNLTNNPYVTQGIYTNNIIPLSGLSNLDNAGANYIVGNMIAVPITVNDSNGVSNMNVLDFYTNVLAAANNSNGAWTDSATTNTKNVVSHIVTHEYWTSVSNSNVVSAIKKDGLALGDYREPRALANASLQTASTPTISRLTNSNGSTITIQISRNYANATPYYSSSYAYLTLADSTGTTREWWLQPALAAIQYCERGTSTSDKLTYDKNTTDTVTDMPNPSEVDYTPGNEITLSANTPKRSGYKFLGWSTNKSASSAEYAVGAKYKASSKVLYAIWQKDESAGSSTTTDNPKTGIGSHLAAFGIVTVIAGGALILAKKKDLFKQI